MTAQEALAGVMEALPELEKFDEHLGVLKDAISQTGGDGDWEQKYRELQEKYKQRFVEEVLSPDGERKEVDIKDEDEEPEVSVEDLDLNFDGSTE